MKKVVRKQGAEMTAEECIDRIVKVLSTPVKVSEGPYFHIDGSSTTIIAPMDALDRLFEISTIIKTYKDSMEE